LEIASDVDGMTVWRKLSGPNLLLNGIWKQRQKSKPTGNPTGAPVKLSGQFVEAVSETMLQFSRQPALLHRAGALGCPLLRGALKRGIGGKILQGIC